MPGWTAFWTIFVGIPLLVLWAAAIVDIFRRSDLSWIAMAIWVVVFLAFPFIGFIVYLAMRPRAPVYRGHAASREVVEREAAAAGHEVQLPSQQAPGAPRSVPHGPRA